MSASSTKRLPWMKFYPVDWRSDALLRSCSPAARGVWIDLMTIMHEAEPYGELRINGAAATPQQLSKLVGINLKTLSGLLSELEKAGVFSRREDGVIYSRRMVRDRDKALKDRQNGEGGGNPALTKGVNPPDNPKPNGGDNATRVGACARDLNAQISEKEEEKKDPPRRPPAQPDPTAAPSARLTRGHRLPESWVPNAKDTEFARSLGLNPDTVLAEFRDYWLFTAGRSATKLDWGGTWRNRCRELANRPKSNGRSPAPKPSGVSAAKVLEEMARGYLTLEAEEQKWPN